MLLHSEPAPAQTPLAIESSHDMRIAESSPGEWNITITGGDPFLVFAPLPEGTEASSTTLAFEYFSGEPIFPVQVYFGKPFSAKNILNFPAIPKAEVFQPFSLNLDKFSPAKLAPANRVIRLDIGNTVGQQMRMRNFVLRPPNATELLSAEAIAKAKKQKYEAGELVKNYLSADYPGEIREVAISKESIRISGKANPAGSSADFSPGKWALMEVAPYIRSWDSALPLAASIEVQPDDQGQFSIELPRKTDKGEDRLLSRWMLLNKSPDGVWNRASAAHWATDTRMAAEREGHRDRPKSQKGLGGGEVIPEIADDYAKAGISAVTVNVSLYGDKLIFSHEQPGTTEFHHGGRTWWINESLLARPDKAIKWHTDEERVVSAILLLPRGSSKLLNHPDADPAGIFTMPDLDDPEGNSAYCALMDFLGERYTRSDKKYGRVTHWIIHNEVDFGWQWTNMGEASMPVYLELYSRSMRLTALEAARWNPEADVMISLTHFWDYSPPDSLRNYAPRAMLDLLATIGKVEGDFPWGVAYHPYPENLLSADPWADTKPTYAFDTPQITPKNLEVLDAYLHQPRFLLNGAPRTVLLSEQGFHTPDYSDASQALQSAALLYTFEKLNHLPIVESFHYHRWIDSPGEGGLQCGLRELPDKGKPFGPAKKILSTYGLIGTPDESKAWQEALPLIGVTSKEEIPYHGPIDTSK